MEDGISTLEATGEPAFQWFEKHCRCSLRVVLYSSIALVATTLLMFAGGAPLSSEEVPLLTTRRAENSNNQAITNLARIGLWAPRVFGTVSLATSICIMVLSWGRRDRVFHRLVLAMGLHLSLYAVCLIVGPAAIPVGAKDAIGNHGTERTCTAQGLLLHVALHSVCCYYSCLSLYSFVGVQANFRDSIHRKIEPFFHVGVHLYPIASGLYLLSQQAFNNRGLGFCSTSSAPVACLHDPDVHCDRGPSKEEWRKLQIYLWIFPMLFYVLLPTLIMIALCIRVKHNQFRVLIAWQDVAKQSVIYLVLIQVVIWTCFVQVMWELHSEDGPTKRYPRAYNGLRVFKLFLKGLFSTFVLLMYMYFSFDKSILTMLVAPHAGRAAAPSTTANSNTETPKLAPSIIPQQQQQQRHHLHIFQSQELHVDGDPSPNIRRRSSSSKMKKRRSTSETSSAFNIFDGTSASGAFANFVFDGDSEDERADLRETKYWSSIQNINH